MNTLHHADTVYNRIIFVSAIIGRYRDQRGVYNQYFGKILRNSCRFKCRRRPNMENAT